MVNITTTITINRPIKDVFAYATNPDNAPKWYKNIKSIEWETLKPLVLGSKIVFAAHFLGRILKYVYEIVELKPNRKLTMKTASGPFLMETTYSFERMGDTMTKMTLCNYGNPTGFSRIVAPFMSFAMRQANKKDLLKIKEILEKKQK